MRPIRYLLISISATVLYVGYAVVETFTPLFPLATSLNRAAVLVILAGLMLSLVAWIRDRDRTEVKVLAEALQAVREELHEATERTVPMVIADVNGTHVLANQVAGLRSDVYALGSNLPAAFDSTFRKGMVAGVREAPHPNEPRLSIVPRSPAAPGRS